MRDFLYDYWHIVAVVIIIACGMVAIAYSTMLFDEQAKKDCVVNAINFKATQHEVVNGECVLVRDGKLFRVR